MSKVTMKNYEYFCLGPFQCKRCHTLFYNPCSHVCVRKYYEMDKEKIVPKNCPKYEDDFADFLISLFS